MGMTWDDMKIWVAEDGGPPPSVKTVECLAEQLQAANRRILTTEAALNRAVDALQYANDIGAMHAEKRMELMLENARLRAAHRKLFLIAAKHLPVIADEVPPEFPANALRFGR